MLTIYTHCDLLNAEAAYFEQKLRKDNIGSLAISCIIISTVNEIVCAAAKSTTYWQRSGYSLQVIWPHWIRLWVVILLYPTPPPRVSFPVLILSFFALCSHLH